MPRHRRSRGRGCARPARIGRAVAGGRRGPRRAPRPAADASRARPGLAPRSSSSSRAAPALSALVLRAVAGPEVAAARPAPSPGPRRPRRSSPTGFASVPPSGPATPVTPTAEVRAEAPPRARRPSPPRPGPTDRAVRVEHRRGTSSSARLGLVRVRDDAAEEVAGRARDLGERVRDEPAGARLGGRDRQAPRRGSAPCSRSASGDERAPATLACGCGLDRRAGGANSHVSGTPGLPSARGSRR